MTSGSVLRAVMLSGATMVAPASALRAQGTPPARAVENANPMDSIARLPGYRGALDTTHYLVAARLARVVGDAKVRGAWGEYIRRSQQVHARDSLAMAAELRTVGAPEMRRAPYAHGFEITAAMTPAWLASDSGRRLAEVVLSYQAPNGGWSKHVDYSRSPRQPGESWFGESTKWQWISTIDNGATTAQLRFLALANAAKPDAAYRAAFLRGVEYLLAAQAPNGCWPQVWPLEGSYHDAITYNDDATVNAAMLLREVGSGAFPFVPTGVRRRATAAVPRVVDCMVKTQVVVNGTPTIWAQQHDPLTFAPVSARSYEMVSLASRESAGIVAFLMALPSPDARVVAAVHHAVDWFKGNEIFGYVYVPYARRDSAGAGPLWARMSEIGTNRPVFSNREGIRLYDYEQLTDRKQGYAWYSYEPAAVLKEYEGWAAKHPRALADGQREQPVKAR